MKAAEIRQKTNDELSEQLTELKKEALNLRFQTSSGQLEKSPCPSGSRYEPSILG